VQKTISSDKYLSLLAWLKKEREDRGLTMRDAAALIRKPHSWVGKIETAERRLDVLEYVRYCQALNIKPERGLKLLK
jgi:transcriptional regulator with XRE-family HTH domain